MSMRAAVMVHTVSLQRQETFDGSFPRNCLTGPVNEEMRSFFNVVFRGRSALCVRDTAMNEKPPSLCTVDSGYMDTDVTKNRSGLTKTMVSRHRMVVSWK